MGARPDSRTVASVFSFHQGWLATHRTVRQLRDANAETIRALFSVVLARTVRELRGESCLDLEDVVPDKQQIMSSR